MAVHEPSHASVTPRSIDSAGTAPGQPYTGVVLIHGIGDIERNDMLQEAADALTYWFNHEAGLALRAQGSGRLWLTTELTEDNDPDARSSRVTIELAAPALPASASPADTEARLDIREVWWAASVGRPNIATAIRWGRVQWREQWAHQLIPLGRGFGPAHTAAHAPARETPQALTYQPSDAVAATWVGGAAGAAPAREPVSVRLRRAALRAALALYDASQYAWKALQWVILTPLIALLLVVMSVLQVLAVVPFLEPAVVAGFNAITSYVMLHWVGEVQVFLLDYVRGSSLRQRFEREVDAFLRDPACGRVVVVAYSMGAAIAYEGLTTALARADLPDAAKPLTFVTVAPGLRRVWLMADADPHRMHGVLPEHVRWVNFWARYDPIPAGPLSVRSLPPLDRWDDPINPNPHAAMCASLERCENIDVANADSTLRDHATYWDNMEQVVGPIARELVAGHPILEQFVAAHLASADDVLRRRGRVAWRATVAMLGGLVAGALFLLWDVHNLRPDTRGPFGFGHGMLYYGPGIVGSAIQNIGHPVSDLLDLLGTAWNCIPSQTQKCSALGQAHHYLVGTFTPPAPVVDGMASVAISLAIAGLGMLAIGRLVALPAPIDLTGAPKDQGTPRNIPVLAGISVVLFAALALRDLVGTTVPQGITAATFDLGAIFGGVSLILSLFDMARRRRWGWFMTLLLLTLTLTLPIGIKFGANNGITVTGLGGYQVPPYLATDAATSALGLSLFGALVGVSQALRRRSWNQAAGLLLLVVTLTGPFLTSLSLTGSTISANIAPYADIFLFTLIYGLWSDPATRAKDRAARTDGKALPSASILRLGTSALVLRFVYNYGPLLLSHYKWDPHNVVLVAANDGTLAILAVLEGGAIVLAMAALSRARRWGWIATVVVVTLGLTGLFVAEYPFLLPLWLLVVWVLPTVLVGLALFVAPVSAAQAKAATGAAPAAVSVS